MIRDTHVYIDSPTYTEAEWQGNGDVVVWTSDGSHFVVHGVSEREFRELQCTADHDSIVEMLDGHPC